MVTVSPSQPGLKTEGLYVKVQVIKSIPCVDSALFMNLHFSALIIIELLPDGCLDESTGTTLSVKCELKSKGVT